MAQNVIINGTQYPLVPQITVPNANGMTIGTKKAIQNLTGVTLNWNQLAPLASNGWTKVSSSLSFSNTKTTITSTSSSTSSIKYAYIPITAGHYYYITANVTTHSVSCNIGFYYGTSNQYTFRYIVLSNTQETVNIIHKAEALATQFRIQLPTAAVSGDYDELDCLMVYDLTQTLGESIAAHLESLDKAGVAILRNWYSKAYYPHTSASVLNANPTSIITTSEFGSLLSNQALSNTPLKGYLKLDANNNIVAQGDTYAPDGTITSAYQVINLGSLNWTKNEGTDYVSFYSSAIADKAQDFDFQILGPYTTVEKSRNALSDMEVGAYNTSNSVTRPCIRDTSKDSLTEAQFKTAMDGVYLVYHKATPTTSSGTAYTSVIDVEKYGSEGFTDTRDIPVPVGHTTYYYASGSSGTYATDSSPYIWRRTGNAWARFTDTSDSSVEALDVLAGASFYDRSGNKQSGAMVNNGTTGGDISTVAGTVTIPAGYTSGGTVSISSTEQAKIIAANIKSGITLLGQAGSSTVKDVSDTTAAAGNVLTGKYFYNSAGTKTQGTMASNGSTSGTISTKAGTVSIPAGYTSGGTVSISSTEQDKIITDNIKKGITILGVSGKSTVVDVSDETATPSVVRSDYTFYNQSGNKVSGTMANNGAATINVSNLTGTTLTAGYYSSSAKAQISSTEAAKVVSGNIKSGVTLLGVSGSSTVVDVSGTTATASDVYHGKTIYGANGSAITGSLNYNPIALNAEQVWTDEWERDLSGTTYSSITTSATQILAYSTWTTQTLNMVNYDYFLWLSNWIQYVYSDTTRQTGRPIISAQSMMFYIGRMYNPTSGISANTQTYATPINIFNTGALYYGNDEEGLTYTRYNSYAYGYYINAQTPALSSTSANSPTLTIRKPALYGRCNNTYFKTDFPPDIDPYETKYHITGVLFRNAKSGESNLGLPTWLAPLEWMKSNFDPTKNS